MVNDVYTVAMSDKTNETTMAKVRAIFEKSGKSLQDLGLAMGYDAEIARQSAFQFLKSTEPRFSLLDKFAKAMRVPLADLHDEGGHDSRLLKSGEEVHLIKAPKKKWAISSYDWSWFANDSDGLALMTAQVFAQKVGWEKLEFDTAEDAYAFVEQQIKTGKVPRRQNPSVKKQTK